jgi:hypothetical protein
MAELRAIISNRGELGASLLEILNNVRDTNNDYTMAGKKEKPCAVYRLCVIF